MTKIEETRRTMYDALAKLKTNPRSKVVMGSFESAMEGHLEVLRMRNDQQRDIIERAGGVNDLQRQLAEMRQERDDCQERMRTIDEAYRKSQEALFVARDELRAVQQVNGAYQIDIKSLREQLDARDETIARLRKSYGMDQNLIDARSVIAQQEQLIAGQRKAIADMHNELTHRRVVCRAFEQARDAFVAMDIALHDAPQSKAIRAVGDDKERAGQPAGEGV